MPSFSLLERDCLMAALLMMGVLLHLPVAFIVPAKPWGFCRESLTVSEVTFLVMNLTFRLCRWCSPAVLVHHASLRLLTLRRIDLLHARSLLLMPMLQRFNLESLPLCSEVNSCKICLICGIRLRLHGKVRKGWPTSTRGLWVTIFHSLGASIPVELLFMKTSLAGRKRSKRPGLITSLLAMSSLCVLLTLLHPTWNQVSRHTWLSCNHLMSIGSAPWSQFMIETGILTMAPTSVWSSQLWTPSTFRKWSSKLDMKTYASPLPHLASVLRGGGTLQLSMQWMWPDSSDCTCSWFG